MATRPYIDPERDEDRQPLDRLALLYTMADHIQRARHVDLIYQDAVDGLRRALGVDRSALFVVDPDGRMRSRAWSGFSESGREELESHPAWPRSRRDPRPVVIDDLRDSDALDGPREALIMEGVRAIALVPLLHRGRLTGQIALAHDRPHVFDVAEIRLAEAIASNLAFAIWRSRSDAEQTELLRRFEAERSVLESVVKQMPAGVLLADVPSGRIILSNPQVSATWGKTLRHASQVSDYAMWGGRDESGAPLAPDAWPLARSVLGGETVQGEEIVIERDDGNRGVVRMSSAPVMDSQGRQLAAVATVEDVTTERDDEARQAFLERASDVLNTSLEVQHTLEALANAVVGYADWCVIYRHVDDVGFEQAAAAHADPAMAELVAAFASGAVALDADHAVARVVRDGEPLVATASRDETLRATAGTDPELLEAASRLGAESALTLPLAARDRVMGAISVVRASGTYSEADVALMTELARRASVALDNALLYEQARAADRAKANFLAVMSHEFRTPLSAIQGYADILSTEVHGELNERQMKHVGRVKASVQHLAHLVDEILAFASMESGRERVRPERVEVVSLITDSMAIMEPIAEAAGLDLRVRLPDRRIEIETDGSKLRQILINLLSNAIKYTPDGHVELRLDIVGDRIRVAVSDTGRGIPAEHLESVFEPYWQVDRDTSPRITGTGLGLAVARRLARLMGGDIDVVSREGEGSTFTLDLAGPAPGLARDSVS